MAFKRHNRRQLTTDNFHLDRLEYINKHGKPVHWIELITYTLAKDKYLRLVNSMQSATDKGMYDPTYLIEYFRWNPKRPNQSFTRFKKASEIPFIHVRHKCPAEQGPSLLKGVECQSFVSTLNEQNWLDALGVKSTELHKIVKIKI